MIRGCSDFEILSQFQSSPDRCSFRVQVKKAASASGFFGFHGRMNARDYLIDLKKGSCFKVGQTVMNAQDYDIGMIIGREASCTMDEEWIKENGIDDLPRGRNQPFYMVLPDSRSKVGDGIRYLAEDVLLECKMEHLFENPLLDLFLPKEKQAALMLERLASEDKQMQVDNQHTDDASSSDPQDWAGCWLVHDITPWD
jgi:hemimethylated DNA binding protein